jgi:hypothetical protein
VGVLLLLGGKPFAFVENDVLLLRGALALPGLRNGSDEFRAAAGLDDRLSRLPIIIKLPVTRGIRVRGVENGLVEERVIDVRFLCARTTA